MSKPPPSYGDVTAEYEAARTGHGSVSELWDLVWFGGADAVSFLEGLLSQNIAAMQPGEVRRSFLLGPKGKLTALLWALRDVDRVGLLTDAGYGQVVADSLGRYRIRVDVTIDHDERALTTDVGPESPETVGWEDTTELEAGLPLAGSRRRVSSGAPSGTPVGALGWTAVRVESGEPLMGVDVDENTIPHETGLVPDAVDFTKGCFLGQELVARIDSRGHVNRSLRGLIVTTNVLPPSGVEVATDEKPVGRFTSPAESLALRAPVGLSLLRREVAAGDRVTIRWDGGEAPAVVADLPMVG
ncbi:folate-binding protein YgfZ [soil metagenome]